MEGAGDASLMEDLGDASLDGGCRRLMEDLGDASFDGVCRCIARWRM